jgi:hypothetical protein
MYDRHQLAERLQRALLRQRWSEVRKVAEQLQDTAAHHEAAWRRFLIPFFTAKHRTATGSNPMTPTTAQGRFRLWIDAVGGFLVCLGDEVALGQAAAEGSPDVPMLADLSRRHAIVRRDAEGYVIEPVRPVKIDGRTIDRPTTLADGRVIELGNGVRLRFRRPHPLSATARLDFVSPHRTSPSVDGVLLMADSCIVGPGPQSHVVARELGGEVVLFRQGDGLACRSKGTFQVDGKECVDRGGLTTHSRVVGGDFSFTLEQC